MLVPSSKKILAKHSLRLDYSWCIVCMDTLPINTKPRVEHPLGIFKQWSYLVTSQTLGSVLMVYTCGFCENGERASKNNW